MSLLLGNLCLWLPYIDRLFVHQFFRQNKMHSQRQQENKCKKKKGHNRTAYSILIYYWFEFLQHVDIGICVAAILCSFHESVNIRLSSIFFRHFKWMGHFKSNSTHTQHGQNQLVILNENKKEKKNVDHFYFETLAMPNILHTIWPTRSQWKWKFKLYADIFTTARTLLEWRREMMAVHTHFQFCIRNVHTKNAMATWPRSRSSHLMKMAHKIKISLVAICHRCER